jgi:hypothetical protein
MGGVIMAIGGAQLMRAAVLAGAILMMPERHALARRDRSHALDRDGQG